MSVVSPASTPVARPLQWDRAAFGVVGVLALLHAGGLLSEFGLTLVAAVPLAVLGIPHGALDHVLARRRLGARGAGLWLYYGTYVAIAGVVAALWWVAPLASLLAFLGLSAHHFGESELAHLGLRGSTRATLYLSRGAMLLGLPFLFHRDDVVPLLSGLDVPQLQAIPQGATAMGLATVLVAIHLGALLARVERQRLPRPRREFAVAMLQAAMMAALPPVPALLLYLSLVHAPAHVAVVVRREIRDVRELGLPKVFAFAAFPVAAAGVAAVAFVPLDAPNVIATLVILLSALTVPHALTVTAWHWRATARRGEASRAA